MESKRDTPYAIIIRSINRYYRHIPCKAISNNTCNKRYDSATLILDDRFRISDGAPPVAYPDLLFFYGDATGNCSKGCRA
jgi:hypothetical protein